MNWQWKTAVIHEESLEKRGQTGTLRGKSWKQGNCKEVQHLSQNCLNSCFCGKIHSKYREDPRKKKYKNQPVDKGKKLEEKFPFEKLIYIDKICRFGVCFLPFKNLFVLFVTWGPNRVRKGLYHGATPPAPQSPGAISNWASYISKLLNSENNRKPNDTWVAWGIKQLEN